MGAVVTLSVLVPLTQFSLLSADFTGQWLQSCVTMVHLWPWGEDEEV